MANFLEKIPIVPHAIGFDILLKTTNEYLLNFFIEGNSSKGANF